MAHGCEKLAQGFYTAATWLGIEPHICDMLVRRPTISHRATILFAVGYIMLWSIIWYCVMFSKAWTAVV